MEPPDPRASSSRKIGGSVAIDDLPSDCVEEKLFCYSEPFAAGKPSGGEALLVVAQQPEYNTPDLERQGYRCSLRATSQREHCVQTTKGSA